MHALGLFLLAVILMSSVSCRSAGSVLPAQDPLTAEEQSIADQIDQHMTNMNNSGLFSGVMLVSKDGKILLSKGYGFSDQEKDTLNMPDTRFPLYVGSKPFTSLAIYLLQMDGKLSLDDPICLYLDGCPASWEELTIDDLLQIQKNIPDYTELRQFTESKAEPISQKDLIRTIETVDFIEESGWSVWSGVSDYILLGAIIEKVSGKSYEQFLKERIFDPVGMKNSGLVHGDGVKDDLALMYSDVRNSHLVKPVDYSHYYSAWGLYSTVEDLYLFVQALDNGDLIPSDQLDSYLVMNMVGEDYRNENGWAYLNYFGKYFRFVVHPGEKGGGTTSPLDEKGTHIIMLGNIEFVSDVVWERPVEILFFGE